MTPVYLCRGKRTPIGRHGGALAMMRPDDMTPQVNARSGGIAMGHPLGMNGARIAWAAARRLSETGARTALVTLCVGVGQGVALALHTP